MKTKQADNRQLIIGTVVMIVMTLFTVIGIALRYASDDALLAAGPDTVELGEGCIVGKSRTVLSVPDKYEWVTNQMRGDGVGISPNNLCYNNTVCTLPGNAGVDGYCCPKLQVPEWENVCSLAATFYGNLSNIPNKTALQTAIDTYRFKWEMRKTRCTGAPSASNIPCDGTNADECTCTVARCSDISGGTACADNNIGSYGTGGCDCLTTPDVNLMYLSNDPTEPINAVGGDHTPPGPATPRVGYTYFQEKSCGVSQGAFVVCESCQQLTTDCAFDASASSAASSASLAPVVPVSSAAASAAYSAGPVVGSGPGPVTGPTSGSPIAYTGPSVPGATVTPLSYTAGPGGPPVFSYAAPGSPAILVNAQGEPVTAQIVYNPVTATTVTAQELQRLGIQTQTDVGDTFWKRTLKRLGIQTETAVTGNFFQRSLKRLGIMTQVVVGLVTAFFGMIFGAVKAVFDGLLGALGWVRDAFMNVIDRIIPG